MKYAELHVKTNFSFLRGASHPDELVHRAAELEYTALAVTDRNSLAGVVRAHGAAKDVGMKLIVGAEITPDDAPPIVLWARDRAAYGRLARLITVGHCHQDYGKEGKSDCRLTFNDVARHASGLVAGVLPRPVAGDVSLHNALGRYHDVFSDRCYLLAELHHGPDDRGELRRLARLAKQAGIPLATAGDVHFHIRQRRALHDVLTAIRRGTTVDVARGHFFANAQRHLKSPRAMATLFAEHPEAIEHAVEIAQRCTFSLDELRYEYPEELAPSGKTPAEHLGELTWAGAACRYANGIPEKVKKLVRHELALIEELHYEAYFLTVWDLVRFARGRGILCQGRGSAANSAVCYCLGITSVDPEQMDVLFERFVSRERDEAPDIDVDFEHERREEVLQYLYEKYGRQRAGMTGVVITYRPRSAVRDVGKALGLSLDRIDALAKRIERFDAEPDLEARCREADIAPSTPVGRQLVAFVDQLVGFPRHLSQHTGGMVMTQGALCELVPIENAAMPGRTVIQWNKDDLDELGILKVDCLALGMLTAIRRCFDLIKKHDGRDLTLASIPHGDGAVYDMICRADTMGVFQIESRAQMSMLPRLRPRCFYDLVIEVAIVRPGPIQGDMVHPYLRRRSGEETVTYPTEEIRQVLEKTLGVPLFQEQAMRLAVVAAGFTPGEADQLRRAMGAWRRPGVIDQFRKKLVTGMQEKGFPEEYAEAVFTQIRGFGDYGFPESHATSFALLVYVSAWLKHYYPAAFTAALLNSQPMGFYAPAQLVRNARDHAVDVLPIDVNHSDTKSTLERSVNNGRHSMALRLGFHMLKSFGTSHAERVVAARGKRAFVSMEDFSRRTRLTHGVVAQLAQAGAFGSLKLDRREALWHAFEQHQEELPLFDSGEVCDTPEVATSARGLPAISPSEEVLADYRATGLSLAAHPISFLREALNEKGVVSAEQLKHWPDKQPVRVAGIVLVRQRPGTAKGITFVTLEDETGTANLIIRPGIWKRYRQAALGATVLLAEGCLQRSGKQADETPVIHVLTSKLENLSVWLEGMSTRARNFH